MHPSKGQVSAGPRIRPTFSGAVSFRRDALEVNRDSIAAPPRGLAVPPSHCPTAGELEFHAAPSLAVSAHGARGRGRPRVAEVGSLTAEEQVRRAGRDALLAERQIRRAEREIRVAEREIRRAE
jgi:hypothetical protein